MRSSAPSRTLLPARAGLLVVVLAGLLASGCSQGEEEFDSNRPDPSPAQAEVVRTPSPLGTDLPDTDPDIVQPLPGPSGGAPGEVPTEVPEASPGETGDGGGAPGN